MKTSEIANKYNIDQKAFDKFLYETRQEYSTAAFTGEKSVKDDRVEMMVERYNAYLYEIEHADEIEQMKAERAAAIPKILVTSGYNFEGYRIVKYSGYISGDDAVEIDRGTASYWFGDGATNVGTELMKSLTVIRRNALKELKEAAYDLGCNAIIGVDFDYMTLDPQTANSMGGTTYLPYVFGVTANGTAVKIEKIED